MKKTCSAKIVLVVMSLLLGCLCVFHSDAAQASSAKKCSIFEGCYKILTVGTKQNVKWKVSGNNCVKIIGSKSNKKVLLIAKKAGKAKITAKFGSKKNTWVITVKKDNTSHLSLKKATVKQEKVVVKTVANLSSGKKKFDFQYGKGYKLYQYKNDKWKKVKFAENYAFDSNIIEIHMKKNLKEKVNIKYTLDISDFESWKMESGLYKLIANTNLSTGKEYVLFEI